MSDKGLLASICGFFKGLFSSSSADCCGSEQKTNVAPAAAAPAKKTDGLTGVERYIRNQSQTSSQLTGVEKYIRNQLSNSKPLTGVEKYIRANAQAKPLTGVEKYIRSKA